MKTPLEILHKYFHHFNSERTRDLVVKAMEDYAKAYHEEQMKKVNPNTKLPTRMVCFFKLKGGKYMTENGVEITTEMLVKYPHQITEYWSFIILD